MPAVPRLLALDLDGTLLDAKSCVPPAHLACIEWLRARDILVVLVTGRPLLTTRWVWETLQLTTPLICFNGVWTGVPGQDPLSCQDLKQEEVRHLITLLSPFTGSICAYPNPNEWWIHRFTPRTRDFPSLYQCEIHERLDMLHAWQGSSCKVMFVCEPEIMPQVLGQMREDCGDNFHIVASQEDRFEIQRSGVTKAWALEQLSQQLGIAQEAVWAVGDAPNDMEMLGWAGYGLAMGHAPASVQAQADAVLPSIDEAGLQVLPKLISQLTGSGPEHPA